MADQLQLESRPRLLYLGHNFPYPPHEGALIRSFHTVRLLAKAFDIEGIYFYRASALGTEAERVRAAEEMGRFGSVSFHPIDQEHDFFRLVLDHARSVLTGESYTRWAYDSQAFRAAVRSALTGRDVDIVHVDSIDLFGYLPELPDRIPVVLAHHNVESQLLRRRSKGARFPASAYLRRQADLVERAEREWCPRVALNVVVSEDDGDVLRRIAPQARYFESPNGVDTAELTPSEQKPSGGLVFVGGHGWFPNADGMDYFADEILPLVHSSHPDVGVRWVGRFSDPEIRERYARKGVEALGYVEDMRPEVRNARCVIVPLRVGGGTRLKILDAWSLGKAVVSTSRGCEGLKVQDEENILIADRPEDFAAAVRRVLDEPDLRTRLEAGARRTVERHYDWPILGDALVTRYRRLMRIGLGNG